MVRPAQLQLPLVGKSNKKDSTAPSGSYWLYTSDMDAPAQFYCDQETNGGGWVMIGHGREGWTEDYAGRGNATDMANNPDGTDAFDPIQLPSKTVDNLLGGTAVNQLEDGIRISRPLSSNGTAIQNIYAQRPTQDKWSWALRAKNHWKDFRFETPKPENWYGYDRTFPSSLGNIASFDTWYKHLEFTGSKATSWKLGFTHGSSVAGSSDSASFLWSPTNNAPNPIGFTQLYLRPKLTQKDLHFAPIADSGLPATAQRALPNSFSAAWTWRTSEETGSGNKSEMNTYVQAFGQVGDTVFIGGDFKNLESKNRETVDQSFIAGFDVNSTELVRSFMPKLNGQVKSLAGLPNGKLALGGDFTQVNGTKVNGFVVLDPVTGAIDKSWDWDIANRGASGVTQVKTMEVKGNYLYIGGTFTHVKGNTSKVYTFSRNAARFNLTNGGVDWKWRPNFNGTVNGISASEDGQSVHVAGYFSSNHADPAWKLAALNSSDGELLANWDWKLSYMNKYSSPRAGFQFDVQDVGNSVFTGGAEHIIAQYAKGSYERMSSSITRNGGDFQDLTYKDGVVYGACHCGDWIYEGSDVYLSSWEQARNTHAIRLVGAFDAATGKVIGDFAPNLSGKSGYGVWGQFFDSKGNLWVGGDINKSLGANGVQKTVGFARFTPRDVEPPATPNKLTVTTENGKDQLAWSSAGAGVSYQVLRNDRVIGSTDSLSFDIGHLDNAKYFVRAVDTAGNSSASTSAVSVGEIATPHEEKPSEAPPPPMEEEPAPVPEAPISPIVPEDPAVPAEPHGAFEGDLIAAGSDWQYVTEISEGQRNSWYTLNTAVSGWQTGKAPIGWGHDVATTVAPVRDGMPIRLIHKG